MHRHRGVALGLVVLVLLGLMAVSRVQVSYWKDSISLWSRTLDCVEPHSVAHNNLGIALRRAGRPEEARVHFNRAITLRPAGVEAYNNLVGVCVQTEEWEAAEQWCLLALEREPGHAVIHQNYALVLVNLGRVDEAIREFKTALEIDPALLGACNGLVKVLAQNGDLAEAVSVLQRTIEERPRNARLRHDLGLLFEGQGRFERAAVQYKEAIRLNPNAQNAQARLKALIQKAQKSQK